MASILTRSGLSAAALAAVLLMLAAFSAAPRAEASACDRWGDVGPDQLNPRAARRATLCLVNRERDQAGKPALDRSGKLQRAAQRHSSLMAETGCFSHDCPGEGDLGDRLSGVSYLVDGLLAWAYGENVAYGTGSRGTPRSIVNAWMNSPPHRAAMLDRSFRDAGVGFALRSGNVGYYTLDLGLRKG
jgi:uncharacterized protein YkwD